MNGWRSLRIAGLVVFATTGSAAAAGGPGATSRGSVSLSITIPPHVRISEAGALGGSCLGDHYHLRLVSSDQPLARADPAVSVTLAALSDHFCAAGIALPDTGVKVVPGPASRPVTLLVVPD